VLTRTLEERNVGQRETSRHVEDILGRWGVTVLHKFYMHEKLVFVNDELLWSGSLNSLSFSETQEVMERRISRAVVDDYMRVLVAAEQHNPPRSADVDTRRESGIRMKPS
jgi:hypothetical protein